MTALAKRLAPSHRRPRPADRMFRSMWRSTPPTTTCTSATAPPRRYMSMTRRAPTCDPSPPRVTSTVAGRRSDSPSTPRRGSTSRMSAAPAIACWCSVRTVRCSARSACRRAAVVPQRCRGRSTGQRRSQRQQQRPARGLRPRRQDGSHDHPWRRRRRPRTATWNGHR